jgi:tetratricopeptide (TPR) repeat protein
MLRRLAGLMIGALILFPAVAGAGQKDGRLDDLFVKLRGTSNTMEAQIVELTIWKIWAEAGDAATDTLMQLGMGAMQGGDLPGALSLFDAVTARAPDFAEGWNKRATVFFMMGAMEKSAEDVARVLALEPRHFGALSGLGLINTHLSKEDAAIAAFEQALKVNPHMPGVKANLETLRKKRNKGAI